MQGCNLGCVRHPQQHPRCQSCILGSRARGARMELALDPEGMGVEVGGWRPGSCVSPQQTPPPLRAGRGSSVSLASRTQQGVISAQWGWRWGSFQRG